MSKLNINKTEWLELVFEGKNKAYGAYQLRQEEGKTTTKAFFSAIAILTGIALLPVLLSSFTDKPTIEEPVVISCPITPVNLSTIQKVPVNNNTVSTKKQPKSFTNPVIKPASEIPQIEETPVTNNVSTPSTTGNGSETPSNSGNGQGNVITTPVIETPVLPTEPVNVGVLEKSPMFPGGINEFLKTVGNRYRAPETEEASTIRIIVFFVVEKDGSLSNIKVPKSAGVEFDAEAIRVLKSIKTKWEPGILYGQPVRTQYSLPIIVKTN